MPAKPTKSIGLIYQLKITLRASRPPIWRRVLVPGDFGLHKLHQVVQIAMGWTNSHLHLFIVDGTEYGEPHADDRTEVEDERRFALRQVAPREKARFVYEYDFGDDWLHAIVVEAVSPPEPGVKYPLCAKGKRACPPEDVGGMWGYGTFLEAIRDPRHEEHASYLEWIGGGFDPEAFDLDAINQALRRVK